MPATATRKATIATREGEEVWETTTEGTVWLQQTDYRGKPTVRSYGGKVGTRIRITELDRELNMDACRGISVFEDGMLLRIDKDDNVPAAMRTEDLLKIFSKTGKPFQAAVDELNELNVRRMKEMAESADAAGTQTTYLDEVIKTKFRKDGDTPTYRSMRRGPQE